jgi:hypothetical protein
VSALAVHYLSSECSYSCNAIQKLEAPSLSQKPTPILPCCPFSHWKCVQQSIEMNLPPNQQSKCSTFFFGESKSTIQSANKTFSVALFGPLSSGFLEQREMARASSCHSTTKEQVCKGVTTCPSLWHYVDDAKRIHIV